MTREEYGAAYKKGYNLTVRFLVSRGLSYDSAQETAQAAWVKGWERLGQLRDQNMVLTWMNSIALNIHRSCMRREPFLQTLPELPTPPKVNLAAIDVRRILKTCKKNDRMVLHAALPGRIQGPRDRARPRMDRNCGSHPFAARPPCSQQTLRGLSLPLA